MKQIFVVIAICIFTASCSEYKKQNYIEAIPSFYKFRHQDFTTLKWSRDQETLKMFHETFKKVGYDNLIRNDYTMNPFMFMGVYIKRPLYEILDSLELTYKLDSISSKYYREFWLRRKKERNDSIVNVIIKEINIAMKAEYKPFHREDYVNDTLFNLLTVEYRSENLNEEIAMDNFRILIKYGFHESAYNLLYERPEYDDIKWNKDSLVKTLILSDTFVSAWWIEDNNP